MIKELMDQIGLPTEIVEQVMELDAILDYESLSSEISLLYRKDTWDAGEMQLKQALGEDTLGIKMLTVMLHCGALVKKNFIAKGIEEKIYIETMKCFTRFVGEHKVSYGVYGFDRSFWTVRQIAMHLFRIEELEYELDLRNNQKIISIHIPSDADITLEKLRSSYEAAKRFLYQFYPEFCEVDMMCETWMLSRSLPELLPATSKILGFQQSFRLIEENPEAKDYLEWVYKLGGSAKDNCKLTELPEQTTLQKNMKQYLLDGGKVGIVIGVLIDDPWRKK